MVPPGIAQTQPRSSIPIVLVTSDALQDEVAASEGASQPAARLAHAHQYAAGAYNAKYVNAHSALASRRHDS